MRHLNLLQTINSVLLEDSQDGFPFFGQPFRIALSEQHIGLNHVLVNLLFWTFRRDGRLVCQVRCAACFLEWLLVGKDCLALLRVNIKVQALLEVLN